MKDFLGAEFNVERGDVVYVDAKNRRWTKLSDDEIRKMMK